LHPNSTEFSGHPPALYSIGRSGNRHFQAIFFWVLLVLLALGGRSSGVFWKELLVLVFTGRKEEVRKQGNKHVRG